MPKIINSRAALREPPASRSLRYEGCLRKCVLMLQLPRVPQRKKLPNPDNFFVVTIQPTEWYALV